MRCKQCNSDKPEPDFYQSNRSRCKECVKEAVRGNRAANIEHYRAFDRMRGSMPHRVAARAAYQQTRAYAQSHKAAAERWAASHPERRKASHAVNNAVRDGRLVPWPVCAIPECDRKPQAHHADYSRPLEVVWLCASHHKRAHAISSEMEPA